MQTLMPTYLERFDKLSPEDQEELREQLATAVFHLASCWDALFQVEAILNAEAEIDQAEIETDHIHGLAGEVDAPTEAFTVVTLDRARQLLEGIDG